MEKRLFDYDDMLGITTWFHAEDNGDVHLEYVQDVEPILELNKSLQNTTDAKEQIRDGWWHYGSIPISLVLKWKIEDGIDVYNPDHMPRVLAKLNERDYSYLKTTTGHHARKDS